MMAEAPLVFVHVPKTGGTTFANEVLLPLFHYRESYQVSANPRRWRKAGTWQKLEASSDEFRKPLLLVSGHMPFGVVEGLLEDPRYMTFLREPVDRAISDYYYCRQKPDNSAHSQANELDIVEFCRRGYGQMQNCHTRYLSNNVFGVQYESDEAMLAAAKANLDRCCFFGLTERFEESLEILYRKIGYGGSVKSVPVRNPSRRPDRVPEDVRTALASYNALDLELYAYACERFEAQASKPERP